MILKWLWQPAFSSLKAEQTLVCVYTPMYYFSHHLNLPLSMPLSWEAKEAYFNGSLSRLAYYKAAMCNPFAHCKLKRLDILRCSECS